MISLYDTFELGVFLIDPDNVRIDEMGDVSKITIEGRILCKKTKETENTKSFQSFIRNSVEGIIKKSRESHINSVWRSPEDLKEEIKKQGESKMFDRNEKSILESIDSAIDNFSERVLTSEQGCRITLKSQLTGHQQDLVKSSIKNEALKLISVLSIELENK